MANCGGSPELAGGYFHGLWMASGYMDHPGVHLGSAEASGPRVQASHGGPVGESKPCQ